MASICLRSSVSEMRRGVWAYTALQNSSTTLRISCGKLLIAFYALVKIQDVKGGDDADKAQWFALDEIPQLAFDHDRILREAMTKLRERIHFKPIGFELLPEKFTLKELQLLYEAILDLHFDRRNFAKKMLHFDLLSQLDETIWPTPKREAYLYSFNREKYNELKQKGFRLEF